MASVGALRPIGLWRRLTWALGLIGEHRGNQDLQQPFEGCGVGISAPADADVDIGANRFVACWKAIDIRAPETLLGALGLRSDTPPEVLREILAYVGVASRSEQEVAQKVQSSGLSEWLSAGADTTTLVGGLASLVPYVPQILAAHPG